MTPADGQNASTVDAMSKAYEESLTKNETTHAAAIRAQLELYGKGLDQSMKQLQAKGDLESLLVVKKEKEQFDTTRKVPTESQTDASPFVFKLREDYHHAVTKATLTKNRRVVDLTSEHVGRLEATKKDLTIKGSMKEALEVKAEIDRIQASAPVTAAKFALAEIEATKPPPITVAAPPDAIGKSTITCAACTGSGKGIGPCNRCNGTGKCTSCKGRGRRPSGFKGGSGMVGCVTCNQSGKCRFCDGTGRDKMICPKCDGTGKVAAPSSLAAPAPFTQPSSPPPPPPVQPTAAQAAEKEKTERELRIYSERMAAVKQKFKSGQAREAKFEDIMADPEKSAGELFSSEVHLVDGRPRQIRVATSVDDAKLGGQTLIPASADVGEKASRLAWSIKRTEKIVIIYGVINKDNFTVFDIRQP